MLLLHKVNKKKDEAKRLKENVQSFPSNNDNESVNRYDSIVFRDINCNKLNHSVIKYICIAFVLIFPILFFYLKAIWRDSFMG